MPTKPHTGWPGSIFTAKANAGRFGYASGGLGTEAHRRSCFTPPETASDFSMIERLCDQEIAAIVTWLVWCIVPSFAVFAPAHPFVVFSVSSKRGQHDDHDVL